MIENQLDLLRDVSERLEGEGIAFMLTGSVAMNHYARSKPTTTFDRNMVASAIYRRTMFNLIHTDTHATALGVNELLEDFLEHDE